MVVGEVGGDVIITCGAIIMVFFTVGVGGATKMEMGDGGARALLRRRRQVGDVGEVGVWGRGGGRSSPTSSSSPRR